MQNGDMNQLTLLAGLARINLGPADGPSHLFPLWFRNPATESFYTPLYGRDAAGASGTFHYWFTPLVGSYRNQQRGGWLFPLFHRKVENESGHGRTRVLWATRRWNAQGHKTSFFPFYSASKYRSPDPVSAINIKGRNWAEEKDSTSLLLLFGRDREVWQAPEQHPFRIEGSDYARRETELDYAFPFWRSKETVYGDNGPRLRENNILWRLYDSRSESGGGDKAHDYVRRRILWRVWHYERLNGDVSVDALPFITYDRKTDGFKRVSFLGRVFRYQKNADGGKSLDLLFLPLRRPAEQK